MLHVMEHAGSLHPARFGLVWIVAAVAVAITLVGVSFAPLATFVLMISAFGLPHVIYELRYVDERFSARTPRRLVVVMGLLVGLIALGRIGNGMHWLPSSLLVPMELGLGMALALVAAWHMRAHRWLGAAAGAAFALGATFFPLETFLAWAWLHNLTPLGFVAEITDGEERRRWLALLAVPFIVLPGLVATGVLQEAVGLVLALPELKLQSAFGAGAIPLMSFLPPQSTDLNLFSAAVMAQAMHYVAVIVLLPRLLRAQGQRSASATLVAWPSWRDFALGVAAVAVLAFSLYSISYNDTKAAYAVAAAIHAWIELPVLLMALGQGFSPAHR